MNSGRIQIDKISLRLRGVTSRQAREFAGSLASEIAEAVGRQAAHIAPGKTAISKLSVRAGKDGKGSRVAEQIRRQLGGE